MLGNDLLSTVILITYYLVGLVAIPTMLKAWSKLPSEVVRKLQHVGYSMSIFLLLHLFTTWYRAVLAAFVLVILAYPALIILEKTSFYQKFFVDRDKKGGELRKQLLYVQLSFAILLFIFWGLLGAKWQYLVAVAVMAWGFGDAAAALVGIFFGKRDLVHRYIEGVKTQEGTLAMIITAFFAVFLTLLIFSPLSWYISLLVSLFVAPIAGFVELFSPGGLDTLTVPLVTAGVLFPLISLLTHLGW